MLKILKNPQGVAERGRQIADIDKNGTTNIFDLLRLLKVIAGKETPEIIYWSPTPTILDLNRESAAAGDTLMLYLEDIDDAITIENIKTFFPE